jgi:hypothetical protein
MILEYPDLGVTLEMNGGTCAGTMYMNFIIRACEEHPHIVGREICCDADYEFGPDGQGWYSCHYTAELQWSDGFIANTDDETLPCYSYQYYEDIRDGCGTPMGGSIVPELDGIRFICPDPEEEVVQ